MNVKNQLSAWLVEGEKRRLAGIHSKLFIVFAFLLSLFQVWSVILGKLAPIQLLATHLSFILILTFLLYSFSKNNDSRHIPTVMDYVYAFLALAAGIYYIFYSDSYSIRIPIVDPLSFLDLFFGVVFVVLSIEAARRTIGIPIVFIIFLKMVMLYGDII